MAKFCGKCGSALNETASFCGGCGNRVGAPAPAAAAPAPTGYTPVQTGYAPVAGAFPPAAAPQAPLPADFAPVPAAFAPVPGSFVSPPMPAAATPAPSEFTPVPPVAPTPDGFTPVQTAFTPVAPVPATPVFEPANYPPVQSSFAPVAPTPAPDLSGFAPVSTNFAPAAPTQPFTPPATPTYAPVAAGYPPSAAGNAAGVAYPAAGQKQSNTLLKVVIACVLLLVAGSALALGGLWYAAQKIKEKAHAAAAQALGGTPAGGILGSVLNSVNDKSGDQDADSSDPTGFKGDPCRFLSKEEVSKAVGLTVIRAEAHENGCSYIAHGDPADMTSKHMSSMVGGISGADAKTQQQIQKIAGAFFAQQEAGDKDLKAAAATGEVPVLGTMYMSKNAELDMKMSRAGFQHVTGGAGTAKDSGSGDMDGIGDEAYLVGGSMLIFRKGNTSAHFTYIGCPCNTDNIKPLAILAASRM